MIRDEPEAIDAVSEEETITISLLIHEAYAFFDISSQDIEKLRYGWGKWAGVAEPGPFGTHPDPDPRIRTSD